MVYVGDRISVSNRKLDKALTQFLFDSDPDPKAKILIPDAKKYADP